MNTMNRRIAVFGGLAIATTVAASPAAAYRGGGGRAAPANRPANVQNARSNLSDNHNVNANRNANVNRNVKVNQNVNVNRNVDVHGGYYGGGYHYDSWGHPVAAAVAVTATAVAVGTMAASLPSSGCSGVSIGGVAYQHCGPNYYQPVVQGGTTQYVVVAPP